MINHSGTNNIYYSINVNPFVLLAIEGMRVVYNITNEPFNRVVSVDVLSRDAMKPEYKPLNDTETYRAIAASFMASGGDGFKMIPKNKKNHK